MRVGLEVNVTSSKLRYGGPYGRNSAFFIGLERSSSKRKMLGGHTGEEAGLAAYEISPLRSMSLCSHPKLNEQLNRLHGANAGKG